MDLFGRRKAPEVDANAVSSLTARVGEIESCLRRLERDFEDMHARYVKARRAASADLRNQEREATAAADAAAGQGALGLVQAEPPASPPWGARARRQGRG